VEDGAGVDAGAATAVVAGERAAVEPGVADGRGVAVADGGDADGSGGRVTVGSDADGNGDPVATGSEGEGVGRIVAIGRDGRGASVAPGNADGWLGPTAAADLPIPTNPPITTSAA
jgi:hypothetical protein